MKKLKIGVIGLGRIGRVHVENIVRRIPSAKVEAIADISENALREVTAEFNISHKYTNYRDLIANKHIDAVLVCSSTDTHTEIIKAAASEGKHIFCEKPIDLSLDKINDVLHEVENAGIAFMLGFNRRFDPNFLKIRAMIRDGKIGDPHLVRITSRDPGPPPLDYIKVSGGMFMDMSIHDFDMARYLAGSEVTEVYAKATVRVDDAIGEAGDVDTAMILLTFENGTICCIDNSRKAVYGYDQRVEVFGSAGMVSTENNTEDNHYYLDQQGRHAALPLNFFMERYTQSYINEMQEFIESILANRAPVVTGKDGLASARIAYAARESYVNNRPVIVTTPGMNAKTS